MNEHLFPQYADFPFSHAIQPRSSHYSLHVDLQQFMNKQIEGAVEGVKSFYGQSRRFLQVCEKPDVAQFKKIATSCAIGFAIMGGIGYIVKLLFIPINNIILS